MARYVLTTQYKLRAKKPPCLFHSGSVKIHEDAVVCASAALDGDITIGNVCAWLRSCSSAQKSVRGQHGYAPELHNSRREGAY